MRLADSLDRHKISDDFKFRPDRTTDFVDFTFVYLPSSAEKQHIRPCPEHSLL